MADEKRVAPSVGPWEVQEILDSREFDAECAKVLLIHGPGGDVAYAAHYSIDGDNAKQRANGRLISAAPDLLAGAKAMLAARDAHASIGAINSLRDAIAKAEGRS